MRFGLMGPFGGGNLGDAAIQQAMIENIRKYQEDAEIFGFSLIPSDTEWRHGIPSFPIQRPIQDPSSVNENYINKLSSWMRAHPNSKIRNFERWFSRIPMEYQLIMNSNQHVKNVDILIVSGGGQLDDSWGGAMGHPYTILKFAMLAKRNKAKVYFVSVGAGPIDARLSKFFVRQALSIAGYRSYRDEASKRLIDGIGFHNDDPVYPDLAFSLPISEYTSSNLPANKYLKVGIGPMAWNDPRVWPEKNQLVYQAYLEKIAELTIWLINNHYQISLIPGEAAHDRYAIDDLLTMLERNGISPEHKQIVRLPIQTVDELMNELGTLDIFMGSRLHSVILSALMNKPLLAISYHPKIDVLMADLGQGKYCLQIEDFEVEKAKCLFSQIENESQTIMQQISQRVASYQVALDEQYKRLFAS